MKKSDLGQHDRNDHLKDDDHLKKARAADVVDIEQLLKLAGSKRTKTAPSASWRSSSASRPRRGPATRAGTATYSFEGAMYRLVETIGIAGTVLYPLSCVGSCAAFDATLIQEEVLARCTGATETCRWDFVDRGTERIVDGPYSIDSTALPLTTGGSSRVLERCERTTGSSFLDSIGSAREILKLFQQKGQY